MRGIGCHVCPTCGDMFDTVGGFFDHVDTHTDVCSVHAEREPCQVRASCQCEQFGRLSAATSWDRISHADECVTCWAVRNEGYQSVPGVTFSHAPGYPYLQARRET